MNIYLPLAIIVIALIIFALSKSSAQKGIHRNFRLDPGRYKLISSDLGGNESKIRLTFSRVSGIPDAIFEDRKKPRIIVGEYKARNMRQGLRPREYFQVVLYIGLAKYRWPKHEVVGLIAYNDKKVMIEHDQKAFDALIALRPEAVASIRAKKPWNKTPLHKRLPIRIPRG